MQCILLPTQIIQAVNKHYRDFDCYGETSSFISKSKLINASFKCFQYLSENLGETILYNSAPTKVKGLYVE